jgi:hypothetical protein
MVIVMINDVVLENIVVKAWRYAVALLFHLACYRHPDLPPKPLNELQDATDFVKLRVPKGNLGLPVVVEKNYHVRVHGFLQSRDYAVSLADFLKDVPGAELPVPQILGPSAFHTPRRTAEAVARRILNQVKGSTR